MFTPDLDLKVVTRCSKFSIQDKTGVDTGDGTKWSGVAGIDPTDLDAAIIRVVDPNGVEVDHDVLSQIPSVVTTSWWFNDIAGTGIDGLHSLIYRLDWGDPEGILAFIDYDATVAGTTRVTTGTHAMVSGMYVIISGTLNYDGEYLVTVINTTSFYITKEFVADDATGYIQRMFISIFYPFVFCRAEAGIDKMFANLSRMVKGNTRNEYQQQARTAYGLLIALKSAISSANVTAMDNLLIEINHILSFYDVDPNL